jgi:hypothetical protein
MRDADSAALLSQAHAWWTGEGYRLPTVHQWEGVPQVANR